MVANLVRERALIANIKSSLVRKLFFSGGGGGPPPLGEALLGSVYALYIVIVGLLQY
jgi:hypothetical protein